MIPTPPPPPVSFQNKTGFPKNPGVGERLVVVVGGYMVGDNILVTIGGILRAFFGHFGGFGQNCGFLVRIGFLMLCKGCHLRAQAVQELLGIVPLGNLPNIITLFLVTLQAATTTSTNL